MTTLIDTSSFATTMRERIIRPAAKEILVANLAGSMQEQDLTVPANCGGLGRIRHFNRHVAPDWPENPLPIDPASRALGIPCADLIRAQVFQNAACAWRCWYCYVPFNLLAGDASRGSWVTADDLVKLYVQEPNRPSVIDLSGGSPDLTPEWIPWMMRSLQAAGLSDTTFLWSDDNLSTDYLFSKLGKDDLRTLLDYRNYGRVCCVKGFDKGSFSFNTSSDPAGFERQFDLLRRYLSLGIDLYGYVTLTGDNRSNVAAGVKDLLDRLTSINEKLPLRVVPLKITNYTPTANRSLAAEKRFVIADEVQKLAIEHWIDELKSRFSSSDLEKNILDIRL